MWDVFGESLINSKPNVAESESVSKIRLKLEDIQEAHNRIKDQIAVTPLIDAKYIGNNFCHILLKCENLQKTGSFKARGVCNVIESLQLKDKSKGCTVTGGRNFLTAMSHYGFTHSVPINIVIPKDHPIADKQQYKDNFAIVKTYGNDANDASLHALTYSGEIGSNYVHGSDRLDLLAGYGTLGLEILSQTEKIDAILSPVGTGGLVASVLVAVKTLKPSCLIYGVECVSAPTMSKAFQEKRPVAIQVKQNIADSLSEVISSKNAFNIIRGYLDKMITVEETWIARAMLQLFEREKLVVEGAAACPVAAIIAGKVPELRGKNVVVILSGGNININRLPRVIERGLLAEGRLMTITVTLGDSLGGVAKLIAKVTDAGADVKNIAPDGPSMQKDVTTTTINLQVEVNDAMHAKEVERKLLKEYPLSQIISV